MGKVKDILRVALRENALYVPPDIKPQKEVTAGSLALVKELKRYGFAVDEPLLHALNGTRTDYFRMVVGTVKEVLGIGLNWMPLVRDWETPTGESAVDHLITLYFNILKRQKPPSPPYWDDDEERYVGAVGYFPCGHYIPEDTFPVWRYTGCPFCGRAVETSAEHYEGQGSKLRLLTLWGEADAEAYLGALVGSKVALGATEMDSLKRLLPHLSIPAAVQITVKENLMLIVDALITEGKEREAAALFKTPTDILRYLWYKKTGFLQLIEPRTIIAKNAANNRHVFWPLDRSARAAEDTKKALRLKYDRPTCARVAYWMSSLPMSPEQACEIMHPKRRMWVRFIRGLRLAEYAKKQGYEPLAALLNCFYNQQYEVWQGKVNNAIRQLDAEATFALLQQRPGMFARSLFATMLALGAEETIAAFKAIVDKVPLRLVLTLDMYAALYFDKAAERSVQTLTGARITVPTNKWVQWGYDEEELIAMRRKVRQLCEYAIAERFAKETPEYWSVYIAPELYNIPLPIGDRSGNVQDLDAAVMGMRFPLEGRQVRLFMQWGKYLPAQHLDMDLSCEVLYQDGHTDYCSFSKLTTTGCQHSGDIREIPDKVGTAEYININIDELCKAKATYVIFTCNAYSNGALSPNMVVGWMDSKYKMKVSERKGVAYDPSTVIKQVRITQQLSKGLVFGLLDVAKQEIIWIEMPFGGQTLHSLSEESVATLLKKLSEKMSIGQFLATKAKGQGVWVTNTPEEAEKTYDNRNFWEVLSEL